MLMILIKNMYIDIVIVWSQSLKVEPIYFTNQWYIGRVVKLNRIVIFSISIFFSYNYQIFKFSFVIGVHHNESVKL